MVWHDCVIPLQEARKRRSEAQRNTRKDIEIRAEINEIENRKTKRK